MAFEYKNIRYDFPVTDPAVLASNMDGMTNASELYVTLSVGLPFGDWNYKLVAGVMYR
jgi:hypothetical protein